MKQQTPVTVNTYFGFLIYKRFPCYTFLKCFPQLHIIQGFPPIANFPKVYFQLQISHKFCPNYKCPKSEMLSASTTDVGQEICPNAINISGMQSQNLPGYLSKLSQRNRPRQYLHQYHVYRISVVNKDNATCEPVFTTGNARSISARLFKASSNRQELALSEQVSVRFQVPIHDQQLNYKWLNHTPAWPINVRPTQQFLDFR